MSRNSRAFTLIELMVVLTIIVVLIAIMLPVIGRAREQSRTTLCSTNMRQMGQMSLTFASLHDGRGPGRGNASWWTGATYHRHELTWAIILNNEILKRESVETDIDYTASYGLVRWGIPNFKTLSCPNFENIAPLTPWYRPFAYNSDAAGGTNFFTNGPNAGATYDYDPTSATFGPYWGVYGQRAKPTEITFNLPVFWYSYGAKLAQFKPTQYMITEWEYASDEITGNFFSSNTGYDGSVAVNMGAGPAPFPKYCTKNGRYTFRHPYFGKSNFVFMDGHMELLSPNDKVDLNKNFSLGT